MILELGDGRELTLPDEMSDDTARYLKQLILTSEERAAKAEADVRALREEVTALQAHVMKPQPAAQKDTSVADAIRSMHAGLEDHMKKMVSAQLRDRKLVTDAFGNPTHSKVA